MNLQTRAGLLKGGRRGASIVAGKADESVLIYALEGSHGLKQMPPGKPFDAAAIAAFKQWIDAGAPWPETKIEKGKSYQDTDVWAFKIPKR